MDALKRTPPRFVIDKASVIIRIKEAFTLWCTNIVPHMPRTSRYTFGTRIETHFLDLLELIYQAYYTPFERKSEKLIASISKTDLLKYLLQIAWENKLIKDSLYIAVSEKLQEVGKILGGWKNSVEGKLTQTKTSQQNS